MFNALLKCLAVIVFFIAWMPSLLADGNDPYHIKSDNTFNPDKKKKRAKAPPPGFLDRAYDFVAGTLSRHEIGDQMYKTVEKTKDGLETREQYGHLFPDLQVGATPESKMVKDDVANGMGKALAKQAVKSVEFLRRIAKKIEFSFDVTSAFGGKAEVAKKPESHSKKNMNHRYGLVRSDDHSPKIGLVDYRLSQNESTEEVIAEEEERYHFGKFKGRLDTNFEKGKFTTGDSLQDQSFAFALEQQEGLYKFAIPISREARGKDVSHEVSVPLYGGSRLARQVDYKGNPLQSSWRDILSSGASGSLNLHYLHVEQRYASEFVYKRHIDEFTFKSLMPSKPKPTAEALQKKDAEYSMAYTRTL